MKTYTAHEKHNLRSAFRFFTQLVEEIKIGQDLTLLQEEYFFQKAEEHLQILKDHLCELKIIKSEQI